VKKAKKKKGEKVNVGLAVGLERMTVLALH